jgi:DNA repair exonuclease SbcCD ATPase subunit
LIEEKTRTELHSLADKLNELLSKFNDLSISDDILQKPLDQLEKWRAKAHEKIDQIAENKRRELHDELDRCRKVFFTKNEEQLEKLNASKKMLAELIQEADASSTQLADLQESIDEAQKYLNTLNAPVINVRVQSSNWLVDICTNFFNVQTTSVNNLRKFKITYVRLNGIIQTYFVLTKKDGNMSDLKDNFIQEYRYCEEISHSARSSIDTTNHDPKCDFILPDGIYQHRVHRQYSDESISSNIPRRDIH